MWSFIIYRTSYTSSYNIAHRKCYRTQLLNISSQLNFLGKHWKFAIKSKISRWLYSGQHSNSHTLTFVWVFFFIFPFYVCFPNVCSSYMKFLASQNANIEQSHMLVFIPFTVIVNFRLCLFLRLFFFFVGK